MAVFYGISSHTKTFEIISAHCPSSSLLSHLPSIHPRKKKQEEWNPLGVIIVHT